MTPVRRIVRLYVAGPFGFYPDAGLGADRRRALCDVYGFRTIIPELLCSGSRDCARGIYAKIAAGIRDCDGVLADLTPFRGPSAYAGSAFEVGIAVGMGKPVFAYTCSDKDYADRVCACGFTHPVKLDPDGVAIENFGGFDALSLDLCLVEAGRPAIRVATSDPRQDLSGMRACLEAAREYFQRQNSGVVT